LAHEVLEVVPFDVVGEVADVDAAVLLRVVAETSHHLLLALGAAGRARTAACGRTGAAVAAAIAVAAARTTTRGVGAVSVPRAARSTTRRSSAVSLGGVSIRHGRRLLGWKQQTGGGAGWLTRWWWQVKPSPSGAAQN
jgi:hypothetical protein